jgi:hypothetical protein
LFSAIDGFVAAVKENAVVPQKYILIGNKNDLEKTKLDLL